MATSPQRPLSSVPKVAIVERFNCNFSLYGEYNMAARTEIRNFSFRVEKYFTSERNYYINTNEIPTISLY